MPLTRRSVARTAVIAVCCLAVIAGILYATGVFDRWRDSMSLDNACAGTLARGDLADALGSDEARARSGWHSQDAGLTDCQVYNRTSEADRFVVDVRWSKDAGDMNFAPRPMSFTGSGPVAPLGHGWSGVVSRDATAYQVSLLMECRNRKDDLFVNGNLYREDDAGTADKTRTAFARTVTDTATRAAERYGCSTEPGSALSHTPDPMSSHPQKLSAAEGTCAPARPFADQAEAAGLPLARETAATRNAPVEDCFLTSADGDVNSGYRALARFGPYPRMARDTGDTTASGSAGVSRTNHSAWATAQCPGSPDRALFTLAHVVSTGTPEGKEKHLSSRSETDVLTAFAKDSARRHGCTDLRLP